MLCWRYRIVTSGSVAFNHALVFVPIQTGLWVSEPNPIVNADVELGIGAHLPATAKEEGVTPLTTQTVAALLSLDGWTARRTRRSAVPKAGGADPSPATRSLPASPNTPALPETIARH